MKILLNLKIYSLQEKCNYIKYSYWKYRINVLWVYKPLGLSKTEPECLTGKIKKGYFPFSQASHAVPQIIPKSWICLCRLLSH